MYSPSPALTKTFRHIKCVRIDQLTCAAYPCIDTTRVRIDDNALRIKRVLNIYGAFLGAAFCIGRVHTDWVSGITHIGPSLFALVPIFCLLPGLE